MRLRTAAACLAATACLGASAVALANPQKRPEPGPAIRVTLPGTGSHAVVQLRPDQPRGPRGVAFLAQSGKRLHGAVVVWGLAPGSRHGVHLHGNPVGQKPARCRPAARKTTRHVVEFPDLVADADGVAFALINARASERVIRKGVYLQVHADPTGGRNPNPPLTCGDLR